MAGCPAMVFVLRPSTVPTVAARAVMFAVGGPMLFAAVGYLAGGQPSVAPIPGGLALVFLALWWLLRDRLPAGDARRLQNKGSLLALLSLALLGAAVLLLGAEDRIGYVPGALGGLAFAGCVGWRIAVGLATREAKKAQAAAAVVPVWRRPVHEQ
ncbi:hypothetical protein ACH4SP_24495 [Streptomyces sp. NPDC021093]|uniref:hypothetical protein n=1 Tax=Streptomyces sp. NPDC021093 TaxID=3365112 RepID=UPI00378AC8DE